MKFAYFYTFILATKKFSISGTVIFYCIVVDRKKKAVNRYQSFTNSITDVIKMWQNVRL